MDKTLFTNALLVTPDGVKKGELLTEDGIIRDSPTGVPREPQAPKSSI